MTCSLIRSLLRITPLNRIPRNLKVEDIMNARAFPLSSTSTHTSAPIPSASSSLMHQSSQSQNEDLSVRVHTATPLPSTPLNASLMDPRVSPYSSSSSTLNADSQSTRNGIIRGEKAGGVGHLHALMEVSCNLSLCSLMNDLCRVPFIRSNHISLSISIYLFLLI